MKHRKGYLQGKQTEYVTKAYTSIRKTREAVNNKELAKELGVSLRTYYNIKAGKKVNPKTESKIKKVIDEFTITKGRLNSNGQTFNKAIETMRKKTKKKGRVKELTVKDIIRIDKKKNKEFIVKLENFFESLYEVSEE